MTERESHAMAWMAFCKGAACMGNRDAGEITGYIHKDGTPMKGRDTFDEWWARYGRGDWERSQQRQVETGWLIELQTNDGAVWWSAVSEARTVSWQTDLLISPWTKDANKAVRFARKEDAERVILAMRDIGDHQYWDEATATDHMWCPG